MEDRRGEGLSRDLIELTCGDARACVSLLGAEAVAWSVAGRALLWRRETAHWDRVAPVLFPCVGWSRNGRITVDGAAYPMPVHGFAPSSCFSVIARSKSSVALELLASDATRAHYPFEFVLRVAYELTPVALAVEIEVGNAGDVPLPYACGWHPGLAWPFAGGSQEDYALRFSSVEEPSTPVIGEGGLFSSQRRPVALIDRVLPLAPALFAQEALCFLDARSACATFSGPGGAIEARARGFRHWALWSRAGAPFLCIEAWTGHGDPEGFAGEFRDKPSMDHLAPGARSRHAVALRFAVD